tara:strand:- start:493 stop:1005 length:513 start_codon:yes stop_codon:yes gene_type:complete
MTTTEIEMKNAFANVVDEFRRIGYEKIDPKTYLQAKKYSRIFPEDVNVDVNYIFDSVVAHYHKYSEVHRVMEDLGVKPTLDNLKATLKGKSRKRPLPMIRNVVWYFLHNKMEITFKLCGVMFSYRDHSSVIHGVNSYTNDVKTNRDFYKLHLMWCDRFKVRNDIKPIFKL